MRTFFSVALAFIVTLTGQIPSAHAQTGDTIDVTVTGYGKDIEAARENALRAAVQQAVGVLVSAETLVENDEIVTDKILSFSGGFIKSHRQLGEPKTENGLVSIRIYAEVKRNDLNERLRSVGVVKIQTNPDKIAFEIIAAKVKEKSQADGLEMLMDMLEEFPLSIYDISGDVRYDEKTQAVVAEIEIKIDMKKYDTFQKECTDLIIKLGGKRLDASQITVERVEGWGNKNNFVYTGFSNQKFPRDANYIVADKWPNFRRAGQQSPVTFTYYNVPANVCGMMLPMVDSTRRNMVIKAMDSDGNVLATKNINSPMPSMPRGFTLDKGCIYLFPWLLLQNGNTLPYSLRQWPGMPDHTLSVPLKDLPSSARISAVHVSME